MMNSGCDLRQSNSIVLTHTNLAYLQTNVYYTQEYFILYIELQKSKVYYLDSVEQSKGFQRNSAF